MDLQPASGIRIPTFGTGARICAHTRSQRGPTGGEIFRLRMQQAGVGASAQSRGLRPAFFSTLVGSWASGRLLMLPSERGHSCPQQRRNAPWLPTVGEPLVG